MVEQGTPYRVLLNKLSIYVQMYRATMGESQGFTESMEAV